MEHRIPTGARFLGSLILLACAGGHLSGQTTPSSRASGPVDREFTLESTMLGYRGLGGEIDGVRNPNLWALTGETVRITIVNGETMVHDVAMEKADVRSAQILDRGASASITFKANVSDTYYCSLPGHRAAGMEGRFDVSDQPRVPPVGVAPAADGRPLNLDFETGTLEPWREIGDAFAIVKAENTAGPAAQKSAGMYWVSSAPRGSARKGILESAWFPVTHPYASFLVSGGAFASTRVEVVLAEGPDGVQRRGTFGKVIYFITGADHAGLRPAVVDLRPYAGKTIFVRLVDEETGASTATYIKENPWAHIAFDYFRFHDSKPFFVNEIIPTDITTMPPMDVVPHAGLSGEAAARAMTVPEGFTVTLFAGEPDVHQPIAFALDDRGRLWVAEAYTLSRAARRTGKGKRPHPDLRGHRRRRQARQAHGLHRRPEPRQRPRSRLRRRLGRRGPVPAVHPGQGRRRQARRPSRRSCSTAGATQDTHETLNTLHLGPRRLALRLPRRLHALATSASPARRTTSASRSTPASGAITRRGTSSRSSPTARATRGASTSTTTARRSSTACVIPHLFHIIQGGRYQRQAGQHFNPYTYDDIKTIADHRHYVGNQRRTAATAAVRHRRRRPRPLRLHDLPRRHLAGEVPRPDLHEQHPRRAASTWIVLRAEGHAATSATHGPDFLLANDAWSQIINLRYGPDGNVYLIDWYDKQPCHRTQSRRSTGPHHGRIFKISHDERSTGPGRSEEAERSEELVELQLTRNDWYVRHARRILQERGPDPKVHARLKTMLRDQPDVTRKLRALWALHATQGLREPDLLELLGHDSEYSAAGRSTCSSKASSLRTPRSGSSRRWRGRTPRRSCGCIWRARCSACRRRSAGT